MNETDAAIITPFVQILRTLYLHKNMKTMKTKLGLGFPW